MKQCREVARLMTVAGCIAAGVLAAGCDRVSQPVAPEAATNSMPKQLLDAAPADSIYVDETIVPDSVKQAALLSDAMQAALSRSSMSLSASQIALVGAADGGYDVFAVPFAPLPAPTANNGPTCDDCVMHGVPLGFSFTYWNNTYTNVEIGSNGFVGFGKSGPDFVDNGCCEGGVIPSTTNLTRTPNIIALSWTDWNPTIGGSITYETRGVAPNRQFVVQYTGLREFQTVGTLTAQLVLDESGDITMYTMNQGATRHYVTQGIQNHEGTDAVFWPGRVHAQYTLTNDAIRFSKQALAMTAPPDLAVGTDPGVCSATVDPGMATANHEATVLGVRSDALALGDAYPKGNTAITWTATDAAPSPVSLSAVQQVSVSDGELPTIAALPNLAASAGPGGTSVAVTAPGASDNCSGVSVAGVRSDGAALDALYPIGSTTITWTATDASGNTASTSQFVVVRSIDAIAPVLTLPSGLTVNATMPSGAVVSYAASASDNVGVASFGCAPPSGSVFAIGTTLVGCHAADAAGNTAAGGFNVKVLGATDQIVNLIEYIRGMPLTDIQKTQLVSVLQKALLTNTSGVCSAIAKLIPLVRAIPVKNLPADKSAHIIADLTRISAVIGCP